MMTDEAVARILYRKRKMSCFPLQIAKIGDEFESD